MDSENGLRKAVNSGYENVLKKLRLLVLFRIENRLETYLFLDVIGVRFADDSSFVRVDRQRPPYTVRINWRHVLFRERHSFGDRCSWNPSPDLGFGWRRDACWSRRRQTVRDGKVNGDSIRILRMGASGSFKITFHPRGWRSVKSDNFTLDVLMANGSGQ